MAASKLSDRWHLRTWLFTDLDGTLIPLDGNDQNRRDLAQLSELLHEQEIGLAYVTGRHLSSAVEASVTHQLPTPSFIISDVGATVAEATAGDGWVANAAYRQHLLEKTSGWNADRLIAAITVLPSMRLQEPEKLGPFKVSYYADGGSLKQLTEDCRRQVQQLDAPYSIISSVDPFNGDGLIDLLPQGIDKAYAARWLATHLSVDYESSIIFSGDSGNDSAALLSGCRAILVGNAAPALVERLRKQASDDGMLDRLFVANATATGGVLAGLRFHLNR